MSFKVTTGKTALEKDDGNHGVTCDSKLFKTDGRISFVTAAVVKSGELEFVNETF